MQNPSEHEQITDNTRGIMVQTDLSETKPKLKFKSETEPLTWSDVLDKLLPQRPMGSQENPYDKSEGCVDLWREWDPQSGLAIWSKTYLGNHELAAFNQWEFALLAKLSDNHVDRTYRAKEMVRVSGTFLSLQNSEQRNAQHLIKTKNEGPTLSDWLRIPVYSGKNLFAHGLVFPVNYLTMAIDLLRALEAIHEHNLVHCDLHPGNICIPAKIIQSLTEKNDLDTSTLNFQLEFKGLTLIDFGYSIDRTSPPPCMLPFSYGHDAQISPHLKKVLTEIEIETKVLLNERGDHRKWEAVQFDQGFWQRYPVQPSPLEKLKSIDWREDLYRLGRLLADIRDGEGGRIIPPAQTPELEALIAGLPEELIGLGSKGVGETAPEKPHRDYIRRIDDALTLARNRGEAEVTRFTTNAQDYEGATQSPSQHQDPAAMPARQSSAPETYINKPKVSAQQNGNRWQRHGKLVAGLLVLSAIAWGGKNLISGHKEALPVDTAPSIVVTSKPTPTNQHLAQLDRDKLAQEEKAKQVNAARQKAEAKKEEQRKAEVARLEQELKSKADTAAQAARLAAARKEQAQVTRAQQELKAAAVEKAKVAAASTPTVAPAKTVVTPVRTKTVTKTPAAAVATPATTRTAGLTTAKPAAAYPHKPNNERDTPSADGKTKIPEAPVGAKMVEKSIPTAESAAAQKIKIKIMENIRNDSSVDEHTRKNLLMKLEQKDLCTFIQQNIVHYEAEKESLTAKQILPGLYSILKKVNVQGAGCGDAPKNDVEVVKLYRKAAERGDASAQDSLGYMYAEGRGVPKDDAEAVKWFRKAAEQGNANGQANLGEMYQEGRGVPRDDAEAIKWYRKAAAQGDTSAIDQLKKRGIVP